MRIHFKCLLKIIVFAVFFSHSTVFAGAYDDFFKAVALDDAKTIQSLLQRGFDPNTRDPKNLHGLFLALREPSPKVAQILINAA